MVSGNIIGFNFFLLALWHTSKLLYENGANSIFTIRFKFLYC